MHIGKKIKLFLSSFTIKLFVWFWLIAITAMISTRFITHQLSSESLNNVSIHKITPKEVNQLNKAVKQIKASNIQNIEEFLTTNNKKLISLPFNIWLKSSDSKTRILSLKKLKRKKKWALTNFITETNFTQPQISLFSHTKLVGPTNISINNHSYQLFISRNPPKKNLSDLVLSLPYWVRIVTPALISFIFCLLLAHILSKPVRVIKKATTKLGHGDFDSRVEGIDRQSGELGQLAHSFNIMAEQLQHNQSAQKRLIGDVSHELRSPLARRQMALGLAQEESTSPQVRVKYLQRCQKEIDRLDEMIENVLSLSRLENTLHKTEFKKLNLNKLIQDTINDEQFIASEKSIEITFDNSDDVIIPADHNLLTSAISNVINNAVKYSPKESSVQVLLNKENQKITLTISDSGEGVPEDTLNQLFSPFYRVNLARDRGTGGTGLGLAIAKQAIIAHRGEIFAKNNPDKGLSVIISIPLLQ